MWAQMEDGPKKNLALCKKAMSPFWDESVPTNWLTDVFLEARASLTQGGDSPTGLPTGLPTSSQIGFPTGFPTSPPTARPSITFGSLFTGIGAGHEALRAVPHQWIFAVECDRYCCDVLRELPAGPSLLLQQKIETVDMDMLPPVDLLLASPPCQGFSRAGRQRPDDPRRHHWRDIERYARANHPLCVVVECVVPFRTSPEHRELTAALQRLRYFVESKVLKSEEFGSKQRRHRVFLVAMKTQLIQLSTRSLPQSVPWPLETGRDVRTLGETILEAEVHPRYYLSERGLAYLERRRRTWGTKEHRREDTGMMPTWCHSYGNNSVHFMHVINDSGKRKLTPLEVWRLMGWHSNPCTNLSDTRSYQAAGNSIDLHVLRPLLEGCAERVPTLRAQHRRSIYDEELGDASNVHVPMGDLELMSTDEEEDDYLRSSPPS